MSRSMTVDLFMSVESKSVSNKIIPSFKLGRVDLKISPRLWLQTSQNLICCVRESIIQCCQLKIIGIKGVFLFWNYSTEFLL